MLQIGLANKQPGCLSPMEFFSPVSTNKKKYPINPSSRPAQKKIPVSKMWMETVQEKVFLDRPQKDIQRQEYSLCINLCLEESRSQQKIIFFGRNLIVY